MRTLLEYISKPVYNFNDMIGDIIFELDESSIELLNPLFVQLITEENYYDKTKRNKTSGRIVWKSKDGNILKYTSHAKDREHRPIEQGGDGEPIEEHEIIDMFKYSWQDIMEMYYDGHLQTDMYGNRAWTIQCKCYLEGTDKLKSIGARPENKYLWAVWKIEENYNTGKLDLTIITIFRGKRIKHTRNQERILIANNGYVKQILPK